ncbi:MAG: serine hydrolase [Acidobacteria bacterium]|nr:serine hydrolase [Acidobacteriota bacterium]
MIAASVRVRALLALCIVFCLSTGFHALAQTPPPVPATLSPAKIEQIDALFAQWNKPDSPGCALAVIKDGQIVYKRGYGIADLEHNVPISPQTVFDVGSMSKQFTAACILILEQQGKLSVNDDIRKYLPELPKYDPPVTIRHLLHHTSGIQDYLQLMIQAGVRLENIATEEDVIKFIQSVPKTEFTPGDQHKYSNSGYFLLSEIVERVSGTRLSEFAEQQIFKPLGMTQTHIHDDFTRIVKNRAIGYAPIRSGGFRLEMSLLDTVGDGGVMTTVEDLFLWDQSFYQNKLVSGQDLITRLTTPGVLNSGRKLEYACGLMVGNWNGHQIIHHNGAWAGYRAEMIRFPADRLSVICLANLGSINPSRLTRQVADLLLPNQGQK